MLQLLLLLVLLLLKSEWNLPLRSAFSFDPEEDNFLFSKLAAAPCHHHRPSTRRSQHRAARPSKRQILL